MASVSDWFDAAYEWVIRSTANGSWRDFIPLGLAGLLVWGLWLYRVVLSRLAKPVVNSYRTTVSVVVPSYREDAEILVRCLASWLSQDPLEVIIVVDIADTECHAKLQEVTDPRLRVLVFEHSGKRSALGRGHPGGPGRDRGLLRLRHLVAARPARGRADALRRPDGRRGRHPAERLPARPQRLAPRRRLAAQHPLLRLRAGDGPQAAAVACLSGRTAAYRRAAILPLCPLEHEFFLGRECIAGDDGRLTWLVLAAGYRTVHQASAQADLDVPRLLERLRQAAGALEPQLLPLLPDRAWKGWLWRLPLITQVTVLQILLTPVTMGVTLGYLFFSRLELTAVGIAARRRLAAPRPGRPRLVAPAAPPLDILLLPLLAWWSS